MACRIPKKWSQALVFKPRGNRAFLILLSLVMSGCLGSRATLPPLDLPSVAPGQPCSETEALTLDASKIEPMYRERLAVDLPTVAQVAMARNFEIQLARQRVEVYRGRLQSSWGMLFPFIAPNVQLERVDGTVRAVQGNLTSAAFHTFQPFVSVQWLLNPGKAYFDLVAARKRLAAVQYDERATALEALHTAANQYYDLALAQSRAAAIFQALAESQEFLRIAQSRLKAGLGLAADELRAQAEVAARQQDLILALKAYYDASVALTLTLNLDSTSTLIPSGEKLPKTTLVREDLPVEDLLALALEHRDDLQSVRSLVAAAIADKRSAAWGGLGPQTQAGYQAGGIAGHAEHVGAPPQDRDFPMSDQQRMSAAASWKFGLSTFGEMKSSKAASKQAYVQADRKLASIRAEVVRAAQDSKAQREIIGKAHQQVLSAEEALRLSKANLEAGSMTPLDLLHAESVQIQARLRYSEAVVRYNQAQINLLAALGLLGEKSLDARRED